MKDKVCFFKKTTEKCENGKEVYVQIIGDVVASHVIPSNNGMGQMEVKIALLVQTDNALETVLSEQCAPTNMMVNATRKFTLDGKVVSENKNTKQTTDELLENFCKYNR